MKVWEKISGLFVRKKSFDDNFFPLADFSFGQLMGMSKYTYSQYYIMRSYIAISCIATDIANLEYNVLNKKGGDSIENHKYEPYLKYDFFEFLSSFLILCGTSYIRKYKISQATKDFDELFILRPDYTTIQEDQFGKPILFTYSFKGASVQIDPKDVIVITAFNPDETYPYVSRGVSGTSAGKIQIDLNREGDLWNRRFFKNGSPSGTTFETEKTLDPDFVKRFLENWERKHKGRNQHSPSIIENGLKLVSNTVSQKELDFANTKRLSRDEILALYKVPPHIVGLSGDQSNGSIGKYADEIIYSKRTLKPIATKIQNALNEYLFKGNGYFEFINIVPDDDEATRKNFQMGIITKNEARKELGYDERDDGNVYTTQSVTTTLDNNNSKADQSKGFKNKGMDIVQKSIMENIPYTDEYMVKKGLQRDNRLKEFETIYKTVISGIIDQQEKDILGKMKSKKTIKVLNPILDLSKRATIFYSLLKTPQEKLINTEGNFSINEVLPTGAVGTFIIDDKLRKQLKQNIFKFSKEITGTTNQELQNIYDQAIENGRSFEQIKDGINKVFSNIKEYRLEMIVRTETIRASNIANIQGRKQSEVVESKQWRTALDERVCEFCGEMHGKVIGLESNYFDKGSTFTGSLGGSMKLNYTDVDGPPLHPNCRCALIPIIKS